MKIKLAQYKYRVGDFEYNTSKIISCIERAKEEGVDIVCFSELSVCGYPPRDFLEFRDFIRMCEQSIGKIAKASRGLAVVVGAPSVNPVVEGKDLFNSAYFIADGEVKQIIHKTLLPTYDIFDEYRYFEPSHNFNLIEYKGKKIAITICEDLWNIGNENPLYTVCPMDELIKLKPDFAINISASPFAIGHAAARLDVLRENGRRYRIPLFYVNQVGGQTEILFDGGSAVVTAEGRIFDEMAYLKEEERTYELKEVFSTDKERLQKQEDIPLIHDALVMGIQDYFKNMGFKTAIIGLSGGIDSAVTAALAVRAIGAENVRGLLMPSQFSSVHSVTDAVALAENLGMHYDIIPIKDIYDSFMIKLGPFFEGKEFDVTEENIQSRVRGILNMAISNKFGNILLNTSNKSEMAVGYGTLYGDLCGGLSVLGDVYKTSVYKLADYINRDREVIPRNSILKPPSAELRPGQKDADSLPDYDILDQILYQYIECCKGPKEIIEMGYDEALVRRILRLVNINEFKRYQTAPVLRVTNKAFGIGRRMPIVAKYLC